VDKLKGMLLDLRLTFLGAFKKPPRKTDRKDAVIDFLLKLPPSYNFLQAMEHGVRKQAELRLIQNSVKINKELKRVEVSFPAVKDSSHLSDNREQALGRGKSLEKRLIKTGRKASCDEQLQDFITRG
jgi:hypothetical protein